MYVFVNICIVLLAYMGIKFISKNACVMQCDSLNVANVYIVMLIVIKCMH